MSNQSYKLKNIDLEILAEKDLEILGLENSEIWFLLINNEPQGPYSLDNLKEYLIANEDFPLNTMAANQQERQWKALHSYAIFSKRKPQLIETPLAINSSESFHVLELGRPKGPFTAEEILEKLSSSQIVFSDELSTDGGKTWSKVHRFEYFDRRTTKEDLPQIPNRSILSSTKEELFKKRAHQDRQEAIFGQIMYRNDGINLEVDPEYEESINKGNSSNKGLTITVIVSLLFAIFFYLYQSNSFDNTASDETGSKAKVQNDKKPLETKALKKAEPIAEAKPIEIQANIKRTPSATKLEPGQLKKTPFEDTSTFKNFHTQGREKEQLDPDTELEEIKLLEEQGVENVDENEEIALEDQTPIEEDIGELDELSEDAGEEEGLENEVSF